ncbi:MAG: hypothetical protein ACLU3F_18915 [Blautia wexlerae]
MYPDVYFHSWQTDSSGAINRVLDGTVDLALTGTEYRRRQLRIYSLLSG